eukprot:13495-Heterococcus_DN1.PRE.1
MLPAGQLVCVAACHACFVLAKQLQHNVEEPAVQSNGHLLLQTDRTTVHYSFHSVRSRPLLSTTACLLRATYYRLQCMLPLRIQTVCSPLFYGTIPLLTYLNTEYALWAILSSASALLLLLLILHCSAMLQHCRPALATVYTTALLCT